MKSVTARLLIIFGLAALGLIPAAALAAPLKQGDGWITSWTTAPQPGDDQNNPPLASLENSTMRQMIRISLGAPKVRLRISNAFGRSPLVIGAAHLALAGEGASIVPSSDRAVTFGEKSSVQIPAGALVVSDPIDLDVPNLAKLSISLFIVKASKELTAHPGSRTTSYFATGNVAAAQTLEQPAQVDHWFFIDGIEVFSPDAEGAIACIGDSITDGRGSTTNGNDRWTDQLADRLLKGPSPRKVSVLNLGIGGNRLLRDGLGPNALARVDRDVLSQPGVRWMIILEGINDIGTGKNARQDKREFATAKDLIFAYQQLARRGRAVGLRVYGGTVMPFEGAGYFSPEGEQDRNALNDWIRTTRDLDGVVDFDQALRDREAPSRLRADADTGDHLHLNPQGYRMMAEAVPLSELGEAK
jgi:lysophospholipase L1-like esterase